MTPANCSYSGMVEFDRGEICSIANKTLPQGKVKIASVSNRVTLFLDWDFLSVIEAAVYE